MLSQKKKPAKRRIFTQNSISAKFPRPGLRQGARNAGPLGGKGAGADPPQAGPKPNPRAQAKPTPKATGLKSMPNIARAVLSIWHEKPHSLSYQARILAMPSPMTRVCVASKIEP